MITHVSQIWVGGTYKDKDHGSFRVLAARPYHNGFKIQYEGEAEQVIGRAELQHKIDAGRIARH